MPAAVLPLAQSSIATDAVTSGTLRPSPALPRERREGAGGTGTAVETAGAMGAGGGWMGTTGIVAMGAAGVGGGGTETASEAAGTTGGGGSRSPARGNDGPPMAGTNWAATAVSLESWR